MATNDVRLNDADRAILRALKNGRNVPANLEDEIDYQRHYISQRLRRMAEHGIVINRGNGLYELVDDADDETRIESAADRLDGFGMFADDDGFVEEVERAREELNESFEERQRDLFGN